MKNAPRPPLPLRGAHRLILPCLLVTMLALLASPQATPAQQQSTRLPVSALGAPTLQTGADTAMQKVAPEVRNAAERAADPKTLLPVIVVSTGAPVTTGLVDAVSRRPDSEGLVFTYGNAPADSLAKAAGESNVLAVISGAPPEAPWPSEDGATTKTSRLRPDKALAAGEQPASGGKESPPGTQSSTPASTQGGDEVDSWHVVDVQGVRSAWTQGFRGDGVNVALLDSGVDFGHPDLLNTYARITDSRSPYYGWPMAFDPHSMMLYAGGIVGDIDNAVKAYGSWFVDTGSTISGNSGIFTTVTATPSAMDPVTHTYTMPGTSKSGIYHIGLLPDEHLAFDRYGEYMAMITVDEAQAGVYDTVYVDLLNDHDFSNDTPLRKGSEVATADINGDGTPDLSTGMLYFIADGSHGVPGSDWLYGTLPPRNGELVAMMGSYDYAEDHGTYCASSIVAQGIIDGPNDGLRPPYKPDGSGGMVQGTAPGSKLIAIGNIYRSGSAFYDAYALITYGLDGIAGSGDEPQIVSASYGFSGGADSGWDYQSRYLTYLNRLTPNQLFIASTGNGGSGYGTVTPPAAAPNVLSVGAATQYGELTQFDPISTTEQITWGDVQPWSNRGPSSLGRNEPDILSIGAWGTGDVAPNEVGDGQNAYDGWGGTSMATPVAAGIMALGYQAFRAEHGRWPTTKEARELAGAASRDLGYGVFSQGAGMLDASRLVSLITGQAGQLVSPANWTPGESAPGFTGYVLPGTSVTQTVTVSNPTDQQVTVDVAGEHMVETGHYDWDLTAENAKESDADFARPDYLWNIASRIPPGTTLMKVTAVMSYTDLTVTDPSDSFLYWHSSWRLLAYQWADRDGDNQLWADRDGNGTVAPDEIDRGEYNRLWYSYPKNDILEGYVADPLARGGGAMYIGLQHQNASNLIPTTNFKLRATFYKREPWSLLSISTNRLTIPANSNRTFTARMSVPTGAAPGAAEGAIRVSAAGSSSVLPVTLNVAAPTLPATVGGTTPQGTTYDSGRMSGLGDWSWRPETGEWRHFFALNNSQPNANTFLWTHTAWDTYPNDIDTTILGAAPWDWFSQRFPALFGPYGMTWLGASRSTNIGGGMWEWETTSDTTSDWLSTRLFSSGLHEVVLHNTWYSGADFSQPFTGTLGTVHLSADHVDIASTAPRGSAVLTFTTDVDLPGLTATGYGLSQAIEVPDILIQPLHTYFHEITLTDTASIEFRTSSQYPIDVDMFVDRWNGQRYEWIASSNGPGPNEFIRLEPALDGKYRIRVDGARFIPPEGLPFNLEIKAVHGQDLDVFPARIDTPIAAGTTVSLTVSYDRSDLAPGLYDGKIFVGVPESPALVSLPVSVLYGDTAPTQTPTVNACIPSFSDVPDDYWAATYVNYLWCKGVVSGYIDQTFRPGNYTSRAQFAKMLVLANGWGTIAPETPSFTDVPSNHWGYDFIETAAEHGAFTGYADGTFHPVAPITRAQVAKLLVLASSTKTPLPIPTSQFSDVPTDYWARPFVDAAVALGLISGYDDGTFRPEQPATRGQLSKMIYLLMRELGR